MSEEPILTRRAKKARGAAGGDPYLVKMMTAAIVAGRIEDIPNPVKCPKVSAEVFCGLFRATARLLDSPDGAMLVSPAFSIGPAFERFVSDLEFVVSSRMDVRKKENRIRASSALENEKFEQMEALLRGDAAKSEAAYMQFLTRYGKVLGILVHSNRQGNVPYINSRFIPTGSAGRPVFNRFLRAVRSLWGKFPLETRGAKSGSRAFAPDERQRAITMRKRGKGTEGGSRRFIAEDIRLTRGVSHKREPAIQKSLQRLFRREGV